MFCLALSPEDMDLRVNPEKELKTPFQRLCEDPEIARAYQERAIQTKAGLDIVLLQDSLEKACQRLEYLVIKNHG
jgi:hypothetical protein